MTSRRAARRPPLRPESRSGRGWGGAGARPRGRQPQVREELPDHGGIVQRGDQAQPTPTMGTRQASMSKHDTSSRRGTRRASYWESGPRESSTRRRGRGRAGSRHLRFAAPSLAVACVIIASSRWAAARCPPLSARRRVATSTVSASRRRSSGRTTRSYRASRFLVPLRAPGQPSRSRSPCDFPISGSRASSRASPSPRAPSAYRHAQH